MLELHDQQADSDKNVSMVHRKLISKKMVTGTGMVKLLAGSIQF